MSKANIQASVKGGISEHIVMLKLLQNGFGISLEAAKMRKGTDFFIVGSGGRKFPVEVKSRPEPEDGEYTRISPEKLFDNLIVIIYAWVSGRMWILPASVFRKHCGKSGHLYLHDKLDLPDIKSCKIPRGYEVLRKIVDG